MAPDNVGSQSEKDKGKVRAFSHPPMDITLVILNSEIFLPLLQHSLGSHTVWWQQGYWEGEIECSPAPNHLEWMIVMEPDSYWMGNLAKVRLIYFYTGDSNTAPSAQLKIPIETFLDWKSADEALIPSQSVSRLFKIKCLISHDWVLLWKWGEYLVLEGSRWLRNKSYMTWKKIYFLES